MPHALAYSDPRIAEARAQFEKAATAPASNRGYKLLYITVPGCGGFHDYDNLRRVEASGVPVFYMNVFFPGQPFSEKGERAPGRSVRAANVAEAFNFLSTKGLDVSESTHAVLLDANNRVVREFDSTKGANFVRDVARYTQAAAPARGAVRS